MKKIFLSLCLLLGAATFVSAQQGGNMQERMAQMKQSLKDSVGLTDEQAQAVMDVQQEFRPKMMELRDVSEADRPAKRKELTEAMTKRWAEVLKDEALAKKVAAYSERRMAARAANRNGGQ